MKTNEEQLLRLILKDTRNPHRIAVSADVKLTRVADVKLTHL